MRIILVGVPVQFINHCMFSFGLTGDWSELCFTGFFEWLELECVLVGRLLMQYEIKEEKLHSWILDANSVSLQSICNSFSANQIYLCDDNLRKTLHVHIWAPQTSKRFFNLSFSKNKNKENVQNVNCSGFIFRQSYTFVFPFMQLQQLHWSSLCEACIVSSKTSRCVFYSLHDS
jgi:hypothetical protein